MPFGLNLERFVADLVREGLSEEEAYRQVYRQDDLYKPGAVPAGKPAAAGADQCPICATAAEAFLPFGLDGRPGASARPAARSSGTESCGST